MGAEQLHGAICEASERVLSAWFYDQRFREAWKPEPEVFVLPGYRAMAEVMAARGATLDDSALLLELRRSDKFKLFEGGVDGITGIIHGAPTVLDPWAELTRLRELIATRSLRHRLLDAVRSIDEGKAYSEVRAEAVEGIASSMVGQRAQAVSLRKAIAEEQFRALSKDSRPEGCYTGNVALDKATGGLIPRYTWFIGAPSSWGKSSFVCMLTRQAILQGYRVLCVSNEDDVDLYARRVLGGMARANAWRLRERALELHEWRRVEDVFKDHDVPDEPWFLDAVGRPVESLAADIRSVIAGSDVPANRWIVAVDYVQKLRSAAKHQDRRIEIAHCAQTLIDAIKQVGAAGVFFSQITMDNGKPKLREADDMYHMAQTVLFGESEKHAQLDAAGKRIGEAESKFFWVDKVKHGPRFFRIPLNWDQGTASFYAQNEYAEAAE